MSKRERKRLTKKKKILITVLSILLCLVLVGSIYTFIELSKVKQAALPKDNSSLGIDNTIDQELKSKNVTNIALFGVDTRDLKSDDGSRSDSIMILSIDKEHNKIKLTSLMRDLYVAVDGHGKTKITHAYAYGGTALSVKTINENFGMNIKDFVAVDFFGLEKIINAIGGVQINVKQSEIDSSKVNGPLINEFITEMSAIEKVTPKYVTKSGLQTLNGMQAVAYARIRYVGNDYARTERQRTVLEQVIKKASKAGISKYPGLLDAMLPYVNTSFSKTKLLTMGTSVLTNGITNVEQLRIPEDGLGQGQMINKVYYLVTDLKTAQEHIYKFIYEEDMPKTN